MRLPGDAWHRTYTGLPVVRKLKLKVFIKRVWGEILLPAGYIKRAETFCTYCFGRYPYVR